MASENIKNYVIVVLGIIFLVGGGLWVKNTFIGDSTPTGAAISDGEVTTVLKGFKYNPDTITVKRGQQVKLTIKNEDNVNHGLHLPQFGVVEGIPPFTTKTVTFTAVETPTNGQAVPTCSQEHGETLTINVV